MSHSHLGKLLIGSTAGRLGLGSSLLTTVDDLQAPGVHVFLTTQVTQFFSTHTKCVLDEGTRGNQLCS